MVKRYFRAMPQTNVALIPFVTDLGFVYHLERHILFESLDMHGTGMSLLAGQGHKLQVSPELHLTETSLTEP